MKTRIIAPLLVVAAFLSLEIPVTAQSQPTSNSNAKDYSITGDSLVGIDHRTAQDDFSQFFEPTSQPISNNSAGQNTTGQQSPYQESLSPTPTSVFFVPPQSYNGNDGAQVQLDLGTR